VNKVDFVIITGLSGAGKTQAMKVLEDLQFFCIGQLVELSERKAHGSLIQCKGAKQNHCSGRSHELRSLYQKKKKRKTPGLRGTARVGMVG
jgi:RNase adaptor protein for sRNA GlmZ degradation